MNKGDMKRLWLAIILSISVSACSATNTYVAGVGTGVTQAAAEHSLGVSDLQGTKALRFEVRPGDRWNDGFKDSSRSEVSFNRTPDTNGVEYKYRFDVLIPSEVNGNPNGVKGQVIIAQWHQGKGGDTKYTLGWPTAALYFSEGKLWASVILVEKDAGMPKQVAIGHVADFQFSKWNSFEFTTVWSQTQNGSVKARLNGKTFLDYSGPNGYPGTENWFKFGIYRINDVYAPTTVVFFKDVHRD